MSSAIETKPPENCADDVRDARDLWPPGEKAGSEAKCAILLEAISGMIQQCGKPIKRTWLASNEPVGFDGYNPRNYFPYLWLAEAEMVCGTPERALAALEESRTWGVAAGATQFAELERRLSWCAVDVAEGCSAGVRTALELVRTKTTAELEARCARDLTDGEIEGFSQAADQCGFSGLAQTLSEFGSDIRRRRLAESPLLLFPGRPEIEYAPSTDEIVISWDRCEAPDAVYELQVAASEEFTGGLLQDLSRNEPHTHRMPWPDEVLDSVFARVRCVVDLGDGQQAAGNWEVAPRPAERTGPPAVAGLSLDSGGVVAANSTVTVRWTADGAAADDFEVQLRRDAGPWMSVATTAANRWSGALDESGGWELRVRSMLRGREGPWSAPVSVRVIGEPQAVALRVDPGTAPGRILVSWPTIDGADEYLVRGSIGGDLSEILARVLPPADRTMLDLGPGRWRIAVEARLDQSLLARGELDRVDVAPPAPPAPRFPSTQLQAPATLTIEVTPSGGAIENYLEICGPSCGTFDFAEIRRNLLLNTTQVELGEPGPWRFRLCSTVSELKPVCSGDREIIVTGAPTFTPTRVATARRTSTPTRTATKTPTVRPTRTSTRTPMTQPARAATHTPVVASPLPTRAVDRPPVGVVAPPPVLPSRTPTTTVSPSPSRTATPTATSVPTCSDGDRERVFAEVRTLFDNWDFGGARTRLAQAPGPCQDDPEIRLYRELARTGQEILENDEIPPAIFNEIVGRIAGVLKDEPALGRLDRLPHPFNEPGSQEAAPFEEALRRVKGGPSWQ